MSEFINTIELLGDEAVTDSIIEGTITEFRDNTLTSIGPYAFYGCADLTTVDLPNVVTLGEYVFSNCEELSDVSLPKLETTAAGTFSQCNNLVHLSLPSLKTTGISIFSGCKNLQSVELPELVVIASHTFQYTNSLVTINAPKCEKISGYGFSQPGSSIKTLDLPMCSELQQWCFYGAALDVVILRRTDIVCTLGNSEDINRYVTGYVYVPKALIDSYKTATNWSSVTSKIRAIEDYPEITGG